MKKRYLIYIVVICMMLLVPFAGMTFWATNETTENTVLAEWPRLKKDGEWNTQYLSEMGTYFEDHFAFRQQLVTANALLRGKLLKESSTKQVVVGSEDWLYYSGTLDDYLGQNLLNERELYMTAHNLELIQQYVGSFGSGFLFTVAPNKNSLYNENMPYYYQSGEQKNIENLKPLMEEKSICYLDLFEVFREKEEVLYFKRDSHWNNKGAVLAYNAMMEAFGKEHETYLNVPYNEEVIHTGDLDEMLYPLAYEKEMEYVYDKQWNYRYVNEVEDNMTDWIETENPNKEGSLLMFRDSFGESLLPFMAEEMGRAYFSRLVPYNLTQVEQYRPNCVVIEKVERNLIDFIEQAPIMQPVKSSAMFAPEAVTDTKIKTEKQGSYLMIEGQIDQKYMKEKTDIYVSIRDSQTMETNVFPAFYTLSEDGSDNGFQLYIKGKTLTPGNYHISVIVGNQGMNTIVGSTDLMWN